MPDAGLRSLVICCLSAVAIAAKKSKPMSVQLARPMLGLDDLRR
jgi:hypothetical protein